MAKKATKTTKAAAARLTAGLAPRSASAGKRRRRPRKRTRAPSEIRAKIAPALRDLAVALDDLHADPANVRAHDGRNLDAIAASLMRFGQQIPIVADGEGMIVAGNARYVAAQKLGWSHLAAIRTELAGSERIAFAIADNRTAELAAWAEGDLGRILDELRAEDDALLAAVGFTPAEVEELLAASAPGGGDAEALPEVAFTAELMEESNYVVFVFGHTFDWQVVEEALGLTAAASLKNRPGYKQVGIGRVVDGRKLLDLLGK